MISKPDPSRDDFAAKGPLDSALRKKTLLGETSTVCDFNDLVQNRVWTRPEVPLEPRWCARLVARYLASTAYRFKELSQNPKQVIPDLIRNLSDASNAFFGQILNQVQDDTRGFEIVP